MIRNLEQFKQETKGTHHSEKQLDASLFRLHKVDRFDQERIQQKSDRTQTEATGGDANLPAGEGDQARRGYLQTKA